MPRLRLNKILAQAGITSRRGGDQLVLEGRVAVNGAVVREPGSLAHHYVLVHKPVGYVTTVRDPHGRPVVTDLVPSTIRARLYPVGRLDADVEGALLLTNDGALTHRLLHPRYGVTREYEAEVTGRVRPADLARWRRGAVLDDGPAVPRTVALVATGPATSTVRLVFTEGRKHEVKRYCQALGHPVRRLRRVAFGPVRLDDLPPGAYRTCTPAEVAALRDAGQRRG